MKIPGFVFILSALFFLGCATAGKLYQDHEFDEVENRYEKAIRWSDYRVANSFRKDAATEDHPPDFDRLNQFKVTSYQVKERAELLGQSQMRQTVEIGYYRADSFIEKKVIDNQIWEYNKEQGRWYLLTGLPDFK